MNERPSVLQALGCASGLPLRDAQRLLLHALGRDSVDRAWLLAHDSDTLQPAVVETFMTLCQRRAAGEPLAYVLGEREFFGLRLAVDARVLDPRPDTETLVEWALELLAATLPCHPASELEPCHCIDLGTGSGAIALAIQHARPDLRVQAVDTSLEALAVAQANAHRLGLQVAFTQSDWLQNVTGRFHIIASNPPYIAEHDPHLAALQHEPPSALIGGVDGLDDIRKIIVQAPEHLQPGGWLLLEHGFDQAAAVRDLLLRTGFTAVQSRYDLGGIERCSGGQAPAD